VLLDPEGRAGIMQGMLDSLNNQLQYDQSMGMAAACNTQMFALKSNEVAIGSDIRAHGIIQVPHQSQSALIGSFLQHRLDQSSLQVGAMPSPVLVPVKSSNYLKQTLKHGFPDPVPGSGQASAVSLSLCDYNNFSSSCYGRRFALLCLYVRDMHYDNADCVQQYWQGSSKLEVWASKQLLPMFVIEI